MQQYADIQLLQSHSTCFGCHSTHHQEFYYAFNYLYLLSKEFLTYKFPRYCIPRLS